MSSAVEVCSNCEAKIGKLEIPQIWEEQVVCEGCHAKLSSRIADELRSELDSRSRSNPKPTPNKFPSYPKANGVNIICPNPNCGYRGPSIKTANGSVIVLCILLFMFILPGILYLIFARGHTISCPHCGVKSRDQLGH